MKSLRSFGKLGVPRPVTGSQPSTALKPEEPHPGLLPFLISFRALGSNASQHKYVPLFQGEGGLTGVEHRIDEADRAFADRGTLFVDLLEMVSIL